VCFSVGEDQASSSSASESENEIEDAAAEDDDDDDEEEQMMPRMTHRMTTEQVEALPDFRDRLQEYGIYGEYMDFRRQHMAGRRTGTRRDIQAVMSPTGDRKDGNKFEYWYPTPSIFKWRFTAAYWASINSLIGSFFFTFNAAVSAWHADDWTTMGISMMTTFPNFIGGLFFVIGNGFSYLQLINVPAGKSGQIVVFKADWTAIREHVHFDSRAGTMGYFIGALWFQVGGTAALLPEMPEWAKLLFMHLPNMVGSLGFLLGGICEVTHNKIFRGGATWREPVWWCTIANLIGAMTFVGGCFPGLCLPEWEGETRNLFVDINFFIGSALYVISSILLIVMWEVNDFGFTLLTQLNHAMKAKGVVNLARSKEGVSVQVELHGDSNTAGQEDAKAPATKPENHFSVRGTAFLVFYCLFICTAILCCISQYLQFKHALVEQEWSFFSDILMQVFVVFVLVLILVVHSTIVKIPKIQPYRCAMQGLRFLLLFGGSVQLITLYRFIFVNPEYSHRLPGEPHYSGEIEGDVDWLGNVHNPFTHD